MPPKIQRTRIALIVAANLVGLLTVLRPAHAGDASPWDGTKRAEVRLIEGSPRDAAGARVQRAGIEIRLGDGWKTYWRYPGDSGLPPRFDFSRSTNVKSVTVHYPVPQRFTDEGGVSIGYKHGVVFPLDVIAQDAGKPVTLALSIDYAICEKMCVPADGKADLTLSGKASEHDGTLAQAEALVPRPSVLGARDALAIRAVKREGKQILVDVAAPAASDLFAEGPTADWALPLPAPVAGAPAGQQRYAFELDGLPPNTMADGATLRLTAVSGDRAIEVAYRLDTSN